MSVLFLATLLAQATSLAVSPILTRIYAPGEFGVMAIYTGLLTVLTAIASLRYDVAIPIARSDQEAGALLAVSLIALCVTAPLVAAAMLLAPVRGLDQLGLALLAPHRLLVPAGFACLGLYGVLTSVATRNAAFGTIARTRVAQALAGPASQIGLGLAGLGAGGLIVGAIVGQSAGTLSLLRHAWSAHRGSSGGRAIVAAASRYRAFPLVSSWGVLADMIGATLALYLLCGRFYPVAVTGYLFLTDRIVGRPLGLLVQSLAPVMFSAAGRDVQQDPVQLRARFIKASLAGGAVAGLWILAINLAAAWLFGRLFGPEWRAAVPFILAVSPWFFFGAIGRLVGPTLQVLQRPGLNAVPQVGGPLLGAVGFVWCATAGLPAAIAVLAYAASQALAFIFTIAASLVMIERMQPGRQPVQAVS